jgi:hypothetical protein
MKITKSQLKQIIKEELENALEEQELDEGLENLTPENLELVAMAAKHFANQPEVLAATIGASGVALIKQLADLGKRITKRDELDEASSDKKRPPGGGFGRGRHPTEKEKEEARKAEIQAAMRREIERFMDRKVRSPEEIEQERTKRAAETAAAQEKRKQQLKDLEDRIKRGDLKGASEEELRAMLRPSN